MARAITVEFLGNAKDLERAIDGAESKSSKFGKTMAKVGKGVALGLGAGLVAGAAGLAKLTQGAIEDEAAQKKLATTLKNTAGATDSQIASMEDWISAQGTALGVTDDELRPALEKLVTATGDVDEAQRQAALAMDVAAGRGISLETVTKAMAKANDGNVGALAKLGIETKNANGETISLEEANRRLAKTFKGQAEVAANTTAGKMQRLKVVLAEAGETIGAKLIPIVTKMADWFLNKGLPAIQMFGSYLQQKLPPIFEHVKTVVVDTFNKIKGPAAEAFTTIKGIVKDFVAIVSALWKRFGATITNYAKNSFKNAISVIRGAFNIIKGIFKVVSSVLKGDWKGAWDGIKSILKGAVQVIKGVVGQFGNMLKTGFRLAFQAVKAITSSAWEGIKNLAKKGLDSLVDYVRGTPGRILKVGKLFLDAGKTLIGKFWEGIKSVGSSAAGLAGDIWGAIRGMLNGAIQTINDGIPDSIHGPGPLPDLNLPDNPFPLIPLAKGGVVRARRGGTPALLAEAGHDEAVIPLSGPHAPKFGGTVGGVTLIANFYGPQDPNGVVRQLEKMMRDYTVSTGRPLQVRTLG